MSRNTKFEPATPIIPKKYVRSPAPRGAVRFSRIILAIICVCLAIAIIIALNS